jgi:tRNA modification GTPase
LLNALAGYDAAIVTAIEGTTRDLVREQIDLQGLPVRIIDTAGLRESTDEVEVEGIRRAQHALESADHALVVVDAVTITAAQQGKLLQELPADLSYTVVRNKLDLSDDVPGLAPDSARAPRATLAISALTGAGVDDLRDHLLERLGYVANDGAVTARRRHLQSLAKAQQHFVEARRLLIEASAGELMADELLQVQNALAEITGQFSSDDLLGEIFSSFCIGK